MTSDPTFNTHEAWQQLGVDPRDPNAMLKALLMQQRKIEFLERQVVELGERVAGQIKDHGTLEHNLTLAHETLEHRHDQLAERVRSMAWKTA